MNCERIQDLILTDFSDGQVQSNLGPAIERHLAECPACRALAHQVRTELVDPFAGAAKALPDEFVWQRIKAKLPEPQTRFRFSPVFAWRPLALAAAAIVVLLTAAVFYRMPSSGPQPYLDYVMGQESAGSDDLGTDIENYFL